MKPAEKETLILKNMRALGISRQEAEQLIADDEAVDRGEAMPWDLTPEQMKNEAFDQSPSAIILFGETSFFFPTIL